MRKNLFMALALCTALLLGLAAVASAKFDTFRAGTLVLQADGGVQPKKLPRKRMAGVAVNIRGKIKDTASNHPAAFREAMIDFDRNTAVNARGLPACKGNQLTARNTRAAKRVCGKSIVGKGSGRIQIAFPEQTPIAINAPITVFNGGTRGNKTTLYIHTFITVPVPAAVVTTVTIRKVRKGRFGLSTVSKIPQIAGGSGSVLDFNIKFQRNYRFRGRKQSYFLARCADGKLFARIIKSLFRNEAGGPRTTTSLNGTIVRGCTPRGR